MGKKWKHVSCHKHINKWGYLQEKESDGDRNLQHPEEKQPAQVAGKRSSLGFKF